MTNSFLDHFKLFDEKEDFDVVIQNINSGVIFRGTNLWVLIFAIIVASVGLNVNSTAVIIGAMLISPLMGPIMGIGLGVGINDLALLKKSVTNYLYAILVGLAASTLYFLLTPLNEAHSELLARTSPNIYDVLIAFFGGLAGIVATSSKLKGNVIPGVAIATALMPPLCTAGYGLATLHWYYFFGAFYLFLINSVFIAAATLTTVRVLRFPYKHLPDAIAEKKAKRIITAIIIITLVPSIYFGYDIVRQDRFTGQADIFIEKAASLPDDYLLNKKIDSKNQIISLTYGGKLISDTAIKQMKSKLSDFGLAGATLEVHQGFAYLAGKDDHPQIDPLTAVIAEKERENNGLQSILDSLKNFQMISRQIYAELKVQYQNLTGVSINPYYFGKDSTLLRDNGLIAVVEFTRGISLKNRKEIEEWLRIRLKNNNVKLIISP